MRPFYVIASCILAFALFLTAGIVGKSFDASGAMMVYSLALIFSGIMVGTSAVGNIK